MTPLGAMSPHTRAEITVFTKACGPLTKRLHLVEGKLSNDSSACRMVAGAARRARIDGPTALGELINYMGVSEAYALGRIRDGHPDRVEVVLADKLNDADPSVIARTKSYLAFAEGEAGLVLLDVDMKGLSGQAKSLIRQAGGVWAALCGVAPTLANAARVTRPSTSHGLRNAQTGEKYPSSGGFHVAVLVADAADIPRFLSDFHDRLWLAGLGWGMVSAAGSFLERSLLDKAVGSPERLIFEGPPAIEPPLEQAPRPAVAHEGDVLDTRRACPPLTDAEREEVNKLKAAEELRLLPERQAARAKWNTEHIKRITASGTPEADARAQVDRWMDTQELSGDFPLPFDDSKLKGAIVTDVVASPDKYVGKTLSDPFEGPAYGRGKAILYRRPNGSLFINSFAHGGVQYELEARKQPRAAGRKQADVLIGIAKDGTERFHTPDGAGYADFEIAGHRETWQLRSKGFRNWLARRFYEDTGGAPNSEAMQSALSVIEAMARFDTPAREVYVRVGGSAGRGYLDLCDEKWTAVETSADGWRLIDRPPVRFRRARGMKALPLPVGGGSVEDLRPFLNVQSDADFVLAISWMVAALRDHGPYPVMVTTGEQGSAKSTFSRILRALTDPNTAPLRSLPRDERDLFIAANNGRVIAFDNVSGMRDWLSDALCRLSTGGGFATRQLYTDQDETLFDAMRPVLLDGISDVVTRSDLADRAITLSLPPISDDKRLPEEEFWAAFEAKRPLILGGLLDAVAHGLSKLSDVKCDRYPRMADFAKWATACEPAMWPTGTFMKAYTRNLDEGMDSVIEGDTVAAALLSLMGTREEWTGKASELLPVLAEIAGERATKSKDWPGNPRALSGCLTRMAPFMRKKRISISRQRLGHKSARIIHIVAMASPENGRNFASAPSAPSADDEITKLPPTQNDSADAKTDGADAKANGNETSAKHLKERDYANRADANGDADAKIPLSTGRAETLAKPATGPPSTSSEILREARKSGDGETPEDLVLKARKNGVVFKLWRNRAGFDHDLTRVDDQRISAMLDPAIRANNNAILDVLRREPGLDGQTWRRNY